MRHLSALAFVAAAILPSTALASCASATWATCVCVGATGAAEVTVVDHSDGGVTLAVDQAYPEDAGVPAELTDRSQPDDAIGTRSLALIFNGAIVQRLTLNGEDEVLCGDARGAFEIPVSEAVDLALADGCPRRLYDAGFVEPPCNDTTISHAPGHELIEACGCGGSGVASICGPLAVVWLLRRRRR